MRSCCGCTALWRRARREPAPPTPTTSCASRPRRSFTPARCRHDSCGSIFSTNPSAPTRTASCACRHRRSGSTPLGACDADYSAPICTIVLINTIAHPTPARWTLLLHCCRFLLLQIGCVHLSQKHESELGRNLQRWSAGELRIVTSSSLLASNNSETPGPDPTPQTWLCAGPPGGAGGGGCGGGRAAGHGRGRRLRGRSRLGAAPRRQRLPAEPRDAAAAGPAHDRHGASFPM